MAKTASQLPLYTIDSWCERASIFLNEAVSWKPIIEKPGQYTITCNDTNYTVSLHDLVILSQDLGIYDHMYSNTGKVTPWKDAGEPFITFNEKTKWTLTVLGVPMTIHGESVGQLLNAGCKFVKR